MNASGVSVLRLMAGLVSVVAALVAASPANAATITVGGSCSLVNAIRAANTNSPQGGCPAGDPNFGVRDTVVLQAGATYTFTEPYAPEVGPAPEATALPHLSGNLTIEGNGAVIERSGTSVRFRVLRVAQGSNVIVRNLTLRGGDQTGGGVGGGLFSSASFVTLNNVTVEDNRASFGAGVAGAQLTINGGTVQRNVATDGNGGGIFTSLSAVIRDTTIRNNASGADASGGGIYSELVSSQSLTLLRSTVSGNVAGYGGGLSTIGPATIANSTISENHTTVGIHSDFGGAGIFAVTSGATTVDIRNSTIAGNATDLGTQTGGIFTNGATVRLANSIVLGNTSNQVPTASGSDCKVAFSGGSFASDGNNVFGLGTGCSTVPSDRGADGAQAFTAVLRPLAVNPPGPMETHRLQRLSPALNGGNGSVCAADPVGGIDQRGVSRTENGPCDIGAVEAQRADLELTSPTTVGRPPLGSNVTLTLSLRNVGPSPATGVTVRAPIPDGLILVSSGAGYDPATGLWTVGSLGNGATASVSVVARVDRHAVFKAEVFAFDQEDPDSVPANDVAGEDDFVHLAITPPGIWVSTTEEAVKDDGLCNIVEAVFVAESDTAPFTTPGECSAGSGADTVHLQPAAKYVSTDVWFSGDAFPTVNSTITIEGNGARIERGITPKFFRALQVGGSGALTLRNLSMHFFETRDETCGGAIHLFFGSLVLDNVFLSQNRVRDAFLGGGAICNNHGNLTATNSRIEDNTVDVTSNVFAARGGGITTNGEPAVTTLTNTSVRNNVVTSGAFASGGGLEVVNGATLTLSGGSVRENQIQLTGLTSQAYGGGISAEGDTEPAEVRIAGTTVRENRVDAVGDNRTALGGGLSLRFASGSLVDAAVGDLNLGFGNRAVGGGGGIYVAEDADLGIIRGVVSGNTASAGRGGGGILSDGGLVDLRDVELAGNGSAGLLGAGGAIKSTGRLVVAGGTIWENAAPSAGGIDHQAGGLEIDGAVLFRNTASVGGGALRIGGPGTKVVKNTTISNNTAGGIGGGIWTSSETTLLDSTVTGNRLTGHAGCGTLLTCPAGGGIHATADLVLLDSEVSSNNAGANSYGGGVWSEDFVFLSGSRVARNAASVGGGVYATGASLQSFDSTVELNQAGSSAGLAIAGDSIAFLGRTTVSGNRASFESGGIGVVSSTLQLNNSTVSGNIAGEDAAGIFLHTSTYSIFASTITGNEVLEGAGGISISQSSGDIASTILAANRVQVAGFEDCEFDQGFAPTSLGYNLFTRHGGCPSGALTDRRVQNPGADIVEPLTSNGGPTPTHALKPSSSAIDAGDPARCGAADQRGQLRPKDGDGDGVARCDIGAVEQQSVHQAPLVISSASPAIVRANVYTPAIALVGTGFTPETTVRLGGALRGAEFYNSTFLLLFPHGEDFASNVDLKTIPITVHRQDGAVSTPLAVTIRSDRIDALQTATAGAGSSASVSATPTTIGLGAAVSATLTNNGGGPATVTAATYTTNPTGGTTFAAGGFVDLQVTGADASDRATAKFYYPQDVIGDPERQLELKYWSGTAWRPVRSQGGARPAKDTTDNPDGTGMGGKFTVTFGNTSTPKITELGGTVLATGLDESPPTTTAAVSPAATASGWHAGDVTVTLSASDDVSEVAGTEFSVNGSPLQAYAAAFGLTTEGVNTVRFRSRDALDNLEPERSLEVRIDKTAPSARVTALAAQSRTTRFTVRWAGSDAASGVASYDVYFSTNGGPLRAWMANTTATSAPFVGVRGRRYGFAAVATDRVGHAEARPTAVEATTRVRTAPRKATKVKLCHKGKTIKVPKSQVAKHRKHGDKLGACKRPKRKPRG